MWLPFSSLLLDTADFAVDEMQQIGRESEVTCGIADRANNSSFVPDWQFLLW